MCMKSNGRDFQVSSPAAVYTLQSLSVDLFIDLSSTLIRVVLTNTHIYRAPCLQNAFIYIYILTQQVLTAFLS